MNKILIIIQREFLSRVQKKSFLLATLLVPLLFPAIIGGMVYFAIQEEKNAEERVIEIVEPHSQLEMKWIFFTNLESGPSQFSSAVSCPKYMPRYLTCCCTWSGAISGKSCKKRCLVVLKLSEFVK